MFNRTNQVQVVDVNKWTDMLLAAHDDVRAIEKIRRRLDDMNSQAITVRAEALTKEQKLYDFYYEGDMPVDGDFERFVMGLIDYRMPDEMADRWQFVQDRYKQIKAERANSYADPCD